MLAQAKFAYNDSMNKSTVKSPFHIVFGRAPKVIVDLVALLDLGDKRSIDAHDFVDSMQELHEQVKHKQQRRNDSYKHMTNMHRRKKVF